MGITIYTLIWTQFKGLVKFMINTYLKSKDNEKHIYEKMVCSQDITMDNFKTVLLQRKFCYK